MRRLIEPLATPIIKYATRGYVAGEELDDAIALARSAADIGYAVTVCYWQAPDEPAPSVAARYEETLRRFAAEKIDGRLAVKVPALAERRDLITEIARQAKAAGLGVDFDSHEPAQADDVFAAAEFLTDAGDMGCAIPGRWRRSLADADRAIDLGLRIRVVKGSWADPEEPDMDMRQGFLRVIDHLAGRAREVGVATHDADLAAEAIARLKAAGTPCEQELLYGLPFEPAAEAGRAAEIRTRIYIPYGSAWLPYSVSRAFKNPRTLFWLARDFFSGGRPMAPPPR